MRAFVITVVFLMAFIASGNALVCDECVSRSGAACIGEPKICAAHVTTCEQSVIRIDFDGESPLLQVTKGCSKNHCEPQYFTKSSRGVKDQIKRVCCKGHRCNKDNITLPPRDDTPNGRKCPACFNLGSYECPEIQTMACKGDETKCVTFKGIVDLTGDNRTEVVILGCVNMKECKPSPVFPQMVVPETPTLSCTKPKE